MQTMTAAEAKQKFDLLMDKAQKGPVAITKHGRRVGVLCAADDWYDFEHLENRENLEQALADSQAQLDSGEGIPAEDVYAQMRAKIANHNHEPK